MEQAKRERLESKGWKIGTVSAFLELIPFQGNKTVPNFSRPKRSLTSPRQTT